MKLFQLIAVEDKVKKAFEKIKQETLKVFNGRHLFEGIVKHYEPNKADGDPIPEERKEMVTTVVDRLAWTEAKAIEFIDGEASKELTNTVAKADIVVDGVILAKGVPVTVLMPLAKRLQEVREYYDLIPTLDLAVKWGGTGDKNKYSHVVTKYRTEKVTVPLILHPATDKHPAQVKEVVKDVQIGTWTETFFSGMAHPGDKAEWLGRIDKLITAVIKAREQANDIEVRDLPLGKVMFDFVHARK